MSSSKQRFLLHFAANVSADSSFAVSGYILKLLFNSTVRVGESPMFVGEWTVVCLY